MKFELNIKRQNVDEKLLTNDLKRVAEVLGKNSVSMSEYDTHGKYHTSTIKRRFQGWNNALFEAGLEIGRKLNVIEEDLFINLEKVWTLLGRQPNAKEMKKPDSSYSSWTYANKFGSWNNALKEFVKYINLDKENEPTQTTKVKEEKTISTPIKQIKRTKREISDRLRFRILMRDGFTCSKCGRTPMKERGVELHVDHIIPWSNGGETLPDNLETKCAKCNLGKGNAFNV